MNKLLLAGAAAALMTLSGVSADARVVCNSYDECWRVNDNYTYPPQYGFGVHDDAWFLHDHGHSHYRRRDMRDHRGYWHNGVWITF